MKTLLALCLALCACTDPTRSRNTLENYGFTDIELGGYDWFACGDDYHFHTDFVAKNAQGRRVSGVVCCGVLKGCTVKF